LIANDNQWVKLIPNTKADSLAGLTPAAVSGTLTVPVGRVRKMKMGPEYVSGLHLRRSAALGSCGAAAPDAAHTAGEIETFFLLLMKACPGPRTVSGRGLCCSSLSLFSVNSVPSVAKAFHANN
jgi:hypothetical protein